MSWRFILELGLALAMLLAGVLLYRRGMSEGDRNGSQGAVLLFVVSAIVAIHALGFMNYRPSAAEAGMPRQALR